MEFLRFLAPFLGLEGVILLATAGGVLLLLMGRAARTARALLAFGALLLLVLALLPLDEWLLRPLEARFPAVEAADLENDPPDGLLLLGGSLDSDLSQAWEEPQLNAAADRLTHFAVLARRYPGARLLISSGSRARAGGKTEAERLAALLVALGIPKERLELETRSWTTRENALESLRLADPKQGERWLLVTSAWHMPRAIGAFRGVGWAVEASPADYSSGASRGPSPRFAGRLARADTALREWFALLAYHLASWSPRLFPGPVKPSR